MAAGFSALDKRINRDTEALHDFLWHGEQKQEKTLIRSLRNDARAADSFLHLGGRLRANTDAFATSHKSLGNGGSIVELLSPLWGVVEATGLYSRRGYLGVAD